MPPSRLRPADYRVMPWKNGGGTTTELAVHPHGAGLDDFLWRISIADIAASGPFSTFPGVDRTIMLLVDRAMVLRGDGGEVALHQYAPHRFAGEAVVDGLLDDGPVRDFNVMARRGRFAATVSVLRAGRHSAAARRGAVLAYCAEGSATAAIGDNAPVMIERGEAVLDRAVAADTSVAIDGRSGTVVIRVDLAEIAPETSR